MLEELRVVVARLTDWMDNSSLPWAVYRTLMACRLVALDKRPRVRPVDIGETLRQVLDKLIMRAAGDQSNTACGNPQMCAGLKDNLEGATHAVGQLILERTWHRRSVEEAESAEEEEENNESAGVDFNKLTIETVGTEEEAVEGLVTALGMEVYGGGEGEGEGEGEEGGVGTQRALGALDFLTQEAEPSGTALVGARNGFNKMSRLAMTWTVWHRWPVGARFAFNCYRH